MTRETHQTGRFHILLLLVILLQAFLLLLLSQEAYLHRDLLKAEQAMTFSDALNSANSGMYNPVPVNQNGNAYLNDARITFPVSPKNEGLHLEYAFSDEPQDRDATVVITRTLTLQVAAAGQRTDMDNMMQDVRQMKECSREFVLTFNDAKLEIPGMTKLQTKQLRDGRTLHLYKNTACKQFFSDKYLNQDSLQQSLSQAQSY